MLNRYKGRWSNVPEQFYEDSVIQVTFECDDGDFAAIGPVYIYRYEYGGKGRGGSMSSGTIPTTGRAFLRLSPNPFRDRVKIDFILPAETKVRASIYDVTGRFIKKLYDGEAQKKRGTGYFFINCSISPE